MIASARSAVPRGEPAAIASSAPPMQGIAPHVVTVSALPRIRQGWASASSGCATAGTEISECTMPSPTEYTISTRLNQPKSAGVRLCAAKITAPRLLMLDRIWLTVVSPALPDRERRSVMRR
ncbi:hypothetical protein [Nocardioides pelophilus]|uniref:hypothetical protein n=1 Tax=Nocardioides pelophilus TaxID=2172019 RepID=UPI001603F3F0|nr:hypothetical protein [Nocardioides pelophilus]